ncbi:permease prefix domain 1-containing protein [Streptomyces sp. RFCAC02]|uniref:permease prefix domain 1-containing protein n=1 Tax=Streptomyces sp. RFCAC02 TaxID=2499143 RepID=UPI0010203B7C|nr:permease prefix domain 1-containing protein [Streptomyces sp. RFCAC02]
MTPRDAVDEAGEAADRYAAALDAALLGPPRAKARLVGEIRDGLADTVAGHLRRGLPRGHATRAALHEFGAPADLVPDCQRELTAAQIRRTAVSAAAVLPVLVLCALLAARTPGGGAHRPLSVVLLTVTAAVVAALAAATLAVVTGPVARRVRTPRGLPLAVAWTGTAAAVTLGITSLLLAAGAVVAGDWPRAAAAGALTAASHAVLASSARACRRCARLASRPVPADSA